MYKQIVYASYQQVIHIAVDNVEKIKIILRQQCKNMLSEISYLVR